ncbi:MAG: hypothetical protein GC179_26450 [Anaerolineaceae bacterium]|nr:hypothetical protein [Anaerolineaceae bacterium]
MITTASYTTWGLIGRWLLAFLGFPIGGAVTYLIIGTFDDPLKGIVGGAVAGVFIGGAQWLALRSDSDMNASWIAVTSAGLAAGVGLSNALLGSNTDVAPIVGRAAITGVILGAVQAYQLQRKGGASITWALFVAIAYTIAWPVTYLVIRDNVSMGYVVFGSSGAFLFQIITLRAVLRLPSKRPTHA